MELTLAYFALTALLSVVGLYLLARLRDQEDLKLRPMRGIIAIPIILVVDALVLPPEFSLIHIIFGLS